MLMTHVGNGLVKMTEGDQDRYKVMIRKVIDRYPGLNARAVYDKGVLMFEGRFCSSPTCHKKRNELIAEGAIDVLQRGKEKLHYIADPQKRIQAFLKETEREIREMLKRYPTTNVLGLTSSLLEILIMDYEKTLETDIAGLIRGLRRQYPEWVSTMTRVLVIAKGPYQRRFGKELRRFVQDFDREHRRKGA